MATWAVEATVGHGSFLMRFYPLQLDFDASKEAAPPDSGEGDQARNDVFFSLSESPVRYVFPHFCAYRGDPLRLTSLDRSMPVGC